MTLKNEFTVVFGMRTRSILIFSKSVNEDYLRARTRAMLQLLCQGTTVSRTVDTKLVHFHCHIIS
jgi:hypothetical protein